MKLLEFRISAREPDIIYAQAIEQLSLLVRMFRYICIICIYSRYLQLRFLKWLVITCLSVPCS